MPKFLKYKSVVITLALLLFFTLIGFTSNNIATIETPTPPPYPIETQPPSLHPIEKQMPPLYPIETQTSSPYPTETPTPTPVITPSLQTPHITNEVVVPKVNNSQNNKNDTIVYVTRTGEKYHKDGCSYLKSKTSTTLSGAKQGGYMPCSLCEPPQ